MQEHDTKKNSKCEGPEVRGASVVEGTARRQYGCGKWVRLGVTKDKVRALADASPLRLIRFNPHWEGGHSKRVL